MSRSSAILLAIACTVSITLSHPAVASSTPNILGAVSRGIQEGLIARQHLNLQRAQEELLRIETQRRQWELDQLRQAQRSQPQASVQLPPPRVAVTFSGMEGLSEITLAVEGVPGLEELYQAAGITAEDVKVTAVRCLSSQRGLGLSEDSPGAGLVVRMNGMLVRDADGKPWAYVMNTESYLHQLAFLARPDLSRERVLLGAIPSTWQQSQMLVGYIGDGTKGAVLRSVETVLGRFLDEYRRANPALIMAPISTPIPPARDSGPSQ